MQFKKPPVEQIFYQKSHFFDFVSTIFFEFSGGGTLAPPVYILKKALWETSNVSEYVRNILLSEKHLRKHRESRTRFQGLSSLPKKITLWESFLKYKY